MADIETLRQRIRLRAQSAWASTAGPLQTDLRQTAPRSSGELQQKTTVRPAGPFRLEVRVAVDYASYVRDGTAPHVIRPRTGTFLAFHWPAPTHPLRQLPDGRSLARQVQHPGTDPDGWYDAALARRTDYFTDALAASTL